ncbi:hypothetical protein SD457_03710 [Coprobacillaceae bacterium CR2/5/TPMF4]|nr:hypothetical protein SD457_03710 [Coprobacillaceae bacterium CR2/5/TPMF4]
MSIYSAKGKNEVNDAGGEMFGMLYYADIESFDKNYILKLKNLFLDFLPSNLTYPDIQPYLFKEVIKIYKEKRINEWFESWFDPKWNNFERIFASKYLL